MILLNRKGDTIVEVMIAVLVLGMALGGAFTISNRSSRQTQANHERYQIQLWVNQQAELLRSDYAAFIKNGNDRNLYNPGGGGVTGLCYGTPCTVTDYNLSIEITNNSYSTNPQVQGIGPGFVTKKYIIKATWSSLATGRPTALELRYDL